jgi:thiol:disulfide interchange protein
MDVMNSAQRPIWIILFVVLGMIAFVWLTRLFEPKDIVAWQRDLAAARVESARTGKPIFAYFTAEWCTPCQAMKRTTWSSKRVADTLARDYIAVRIDIEQQPNVAFDYRAETIPLMLLLDPNGNVQRGVSLYMDEQQFLSWLQG